MAYFLTVTLCMGLWVTWYIKTRVYIEHPIYIDDNSDPTYIKIDVTDWVNEGGVLIVRNGRNAAIRRTSPPTIDSPAIIALINKAMRKMGGNGIAA